LKISVDRGRCRPQSKHEYIEPKPSKGLPLARLDAG
jgi:hypothetical protein